MWSGLINVSTASDNKETSSVYRYNVLFNLITWIKIRFTMLGILHFPIRQTTRKNGSEIEGK